MKIGVLHPVTGALAYSGQQGRLGAPMAIDEINAAGGIKALGGAKIEPRARRRAIDARWRQRRGREDEFGRRRRAIVGGYASGICLATTQAAARYDLPYVVDVGVADAIVDARPEEHLPLRPRLRRASPRPRWTISSPSTTRPASRPRP